MGMESKVEVSSPKALSLLICLDLPQPSRLIKLLFFISIVRFWKRFLLCMKSIHNSVLWKRLNVKLIFKLGISYKGMGLSLGVPVFPLLGNCQLISDHSLLKANEWHFEICEVSSDTLMYLRNIHLFLIVILFSIT